MKPAHAKIALRGSQPTPGKAAAHTEYTRSVTHLRMIKREQLEIVRADFRIPERIFRFEVRLEDFEREHLLMALIQPNGLALGGRRAKQIEKDRYSCSPKVCQALFLNHDRF